MECQFEISRSNNTTWRTFDDYFLGNVDFLFCEDGHVIKVSRSKDEVFILSFTDALSFAKVAYEIGNRHQPVMIEEFRITVLDDISLADIIKDCYANEAIKVEKTKAYFKANGKAHHSH